MSGIKTLEKTTFASPLPSRTTRRILKRSRASSRGASVVRTPDNGKLQVVQFESKLEQRVKFMLLARSDVRDIREQPPGVTYVDCRGKRRTHTFDFLLTMTNGRRIAVAVKPHTRVVKSHFVEELKLVRAATPRRFADDVVLITDRQISKAAALNAARFQEFQKHPDAEADRCIASLAASTHEPVSVESLVEQSGLAGRAYRAIVRAIFGGLLKAENLDVLDYSTVVQKGEAA